MNLSWKIVRFHLKETFSIAYGNYSYRDALIISLQYNKSTGYGECTAIDYYAINLDDFTAKLNLVKEEIEKQKIKLPCEFYEFLLTLNLPSFLRSALDCAYWDLFGKLENKSFIQINSITTNFLPQSSITISVDTLENQIDKIRKSKWSKFKVKCNQFDKEAVLKLSELDYDIALDTNGSFKKEDCIWLENMNQISKFSYLEQPMKVGFENFSFLNSNKSVNWMADEDCQDTNSLLELKPHYKSINIKLVKCGGLTPALKLIYEAKKIKFQIMIGCMTESSIGISAAAVLAPLCDYADLDGANLIANDIATGSKVTNSSIHLSSNAGLGIQLN